MFVIVAPPTFIQELSRKLLQRQPKRAKAAPRGAARDRPRTTGLATLAVVASRGCWLAERMRDNLGGREQGCERGELLML